MANIVPLFARQAIYNLKHEVVAYELLFRQQNTENASVVDGDMATAQVLLNAFGEHHIQGVIGNKKAFVNYTRTLICSPPPLPSEQLVIEVLEDIKVDREVLIGIQRLKKSGYKIALDDFVLNTHTRALTPYADFIKVDVLALSPAEIQKTVEELRPFNKILLAEKVEDHHMMALCIKLGFSLFQGYFLCKPHTVKGHAASEGKQAIVKLISALNDPAIEMEKITTIIATDPSLSYKMLKLVNSASIGLPRHIDSLRQAVSLLGIRTIRNWATYLLMANHTDKPKELCVMSMGQAKFCQLIAEKSGDKALADACFTAGLLDNLDAFLDLPMDQLLAKLQLTSTIHNALVHGSGTIGEILTLVRHYERGNWDAINWKHLEDLGLSTADTHQLYAHSIRWATDAVNE